VRLSPASSCSIRLWKFFIGILCAHAFVLVSSSFQNSNPHDHHDQAQSTILSSNTLLFLQQKHPASTTSTKASSLPPIVDDLLVQAGIPKDRVLSCESMDNVKGAYCNQVLRLTLSSEESSTTTTTLIAKIFSTLAQKRMLSVHDCLDFHQTAGANHLGPEVVATVVSNNNNDDDDNASPSAGVLMKAFVGRTLTDHDLHGSDVAQCPATRDLLHATAVALARLHLMGTTASCSTSTSGMTPSSGDALNDRKEEYDNKNVLLHACEVMLSLCDSGWSLATPHWNSLEQLRETFNDQKDRLRKALTNDHGGMVQTGHGDFKPSNIMLVDVQQSTTSSSVTIMRDGEIRFVDWDLTGPNYRAYDVAKLFRTNQPTEYTCRNRRYFLETYAVAYNKDSPAHQPRLSPDVLEAQIQLILPMTWLEAAIFFVCMASNTVDSGSVSRWNKLAFDRLECYRAGLIEV